MVDGEITILLGNGDGTFRNSGEYATGMSPVAMVAGDFRGEGRIDLAVAGDDITDDGASGRTGGVIMLLGNGDGTFQSGVELALGTDPESLITGDFNRDGKVDLAVAVTDSSEVSVFLGNGDGTFRPATTTSLAANASTLVAGDFNGDGNLDLAAIILGSGVFGPSGYGVNTVSVFMGHGDGTFQTFRMTLTRSARIRKRSSRATLTVTDILTWPSPTQPQTMSPSSSATATGLFSRQWNTPWGNFQIALSRPTSMATDGSTWRFAMNLGRFPFC